MKVSGRVGAPEEEEGGEGGGRKRDHGAVRLPRYRTALAAASGSPKLLTAIRRHSTPSKKAQPKQRQHKKKQTKKNPTMLSGVCLRMLLTLGSARSLLRHS